MKYTAIICTMSGTYIETKHYTSKRALLRDLAELLPLCYSVEVMEYLVWWTRSIVD